MSVQPPQVDLRGQRHIRIIPSVYPPINFFEDLVEPSEMETLWEIENITNERLRQTTGDIFLVPPEDRISGHGSSVVMAAFTHIGRSSRFTDGSYGVYYASFSQDTAIRETVYHRERFLSATNEEPCEIAMRMYEGKVMQPLHDIRDRVYSSFHHHNDYLHTQMFGKQLRQQNSWGIVYNSVRDEGGCNIAALRPTSISIPKVLSHLKYLWNGVQIIDVIRTKSMLKFG